MRAFWFYLIIALLLLSVLILQPTRILSESYYAQNKEPGGCYANITSSVTSLDFFTWKVGAPHRLIVYPQSFALEEWGDEIVNIAVRGAETSDIYYDQSVRAGSDDVLSVELSSSIEEDIYLDVTMGDTECRRVFIYNEEQKFALRLFHIT